MDTCQKNSAREWVRSEDISNEWCENENGMTDKQCENVSECMHDECEGPGKCMHDDWFQEKDKICGMSDVSIWV